jgi:hypothetical protein
MKENETLNIRQLTVLFYCGKLLTTEIKQVNAKSGLLAQHRINSSPNYHEYSVWNGNSVLIFAQEHDYFAYIK